MRRRNPEVRHWLDKLSIQDRDEKENAVSKLGRSSSKRHGTAERLRSGR